MIVSDHSPCTAEMKRLDVGKFGSAWGGIASLQIAFTMTWTEGRKVRTHPCSYKLLYLVDLTCAVERFQ